ncbi:hypothetical protein [Palleronia caenipelagi]|nr:hypothetical protein [Palleronia caenipelagi]
MIFAVLLIAAAIAATVFVGVMGGGIWGALGFAALLILAYRALTYDSSPSRSGPRHGYNAFQRWASKD